MQDWLKKMELKFQQMQEDDRLAKEKGELLNRYIQHQYADGYAYYKIMKVNKRTVRIQVVTGIGDDWVVPAWGALATIKKEQAEQFLRQRDFMEELFAKR